MASSSTFIWSSGIGSLTEHETQHFPARLADQQAPEILAFLCGSLSRIGVTGIDNQAMPSPTPFFFRVSSYNFGGSCYVDQAGL